MRNSYLAFAAAALVCAPAALHAQAHRPATPPVDPVSVPTVQTPATGHLSEQVETPSRPRASAAVSERPASTRVRQASPARASASAPVTATQNSDAPAVRRTEVEVAQLETVRPAHEADVRSSAAVAPTTSEAAKAPAATPARTSGGTSAKAGSAREQAENSGGLSLAGRAASLVGKLLLVLVIAYASLAGLKLYSTRSSRPFHFGSRALQVEESAPLGAGAAVHLVRIASQRWLIGTAQGQVSLLASVDEAGEMQPAMTGTAEQEGSSKVNASPFEGEAAHTILSTLSLVQRPHRDEAHRPAAAVSGSLRQTSTFIGEMRSRLGSARHN